MLIVAEAAEGADGGPVPSPGQLASGAHCLEVLVERGGRRAVLAFDAPDPDAVARALAARGAGVLRIWPATVHAPPSGAAADAGPAQPQAPREIVVVERSFEQAADFAELQAREDRGAWCLELHGVRFLRTFFSTDRRRMLCFYEAPDAESVRIAQGTIAMPVERVWSARPRR